MKHGSLFSGIGGFDLASEWMGWNNVFHCEINDFCKRILKHYWPGATSYHDIKTTNFTIHKGTIDILTGGFPCQPYSTAGKRKGKDDDRHLWPEMLRAIREIQPRWIVGENVRGLVNWNGGMVFDEVQADLEAEGYEVLPFLLPACAVNAPHRRDRVWFVAYNPSQRFRKAGENFIRPSQWVTGISSERLIADADINIGCERGLYETEPETAKRHAGSFDSRAGWAAWQNFPTVAPVCGGDDGLPCELDRITFPKWRNESIKGFGNAVVPQVVYQIFKAIEAYEATSKCIQS